MKSLTRTERNWLYLALGTFLILGAASYFWHLSSPDLIHEASAHVYGNPALSLQDIQLDVFYVVPKDKTAYNYSDLQKQIGEILIKTGNFHETQFGDKSHLHYRVFPRPVVLNNDGFFYDTEDTKFGNPQALKNTTLELEARVYDPKGDLFEKEFITPADYFRIIAIIYEGVGAAGTEGSSLLSRDFVSREEYEPVRASLFYHEFGHAMGLPEGYDILTNRPFTNDIMGSGRRAPIEGNYIDQSSLREMGA